jgi:hypothetical protein
LFAIEVEGSAVEALKGIAACEDGDAFQFCPPTRVWLGDCAQ